MRTGQKHGASTLLLVGSTSFYSEARTVKCGQADGAVPHTSVDNLSEMETNNISPYGLESVYFLLQRTI